MKKLLASLLLLLTMSTAQAQIVGTLPYTFVNGVTADATQVMANYNYIISQVNANAANGGANSSITSILGLTTPLSPGQGGSKYYSAGTSTGTANAQVVSTGITPTGFTLASGKVIYFIAGATNTGATTFTINGTAATAVEKLSSSGLLPLVGGEIVAGNPVLAFFDGTQYNLITPLSIKLLGKSVTLASATTTDLGTAATNTVTISGTTTITSFGSTAQVDYPLYNLKFSGSLTLTYNASSLILPGSANIVTQANDTATALYLGSGNWQFTSYQPATGTNLIPPVVPCSISHLISNNDGTTPNTKIDITDDYSILTTSLGYPIKSTSDNLVINLNVNGANGLDTGSIAASTWYFTYIVNNGTTTAGLASTSATSPTLPAGYTYTCRAGAFITDASSNLRRIVQRGVHTDYALVTGVTNNTLYRTLASGSNSGVWTAVSVSGTFVPTTASEIRGFILFTGPSNTSAFVSPNNVQTYSGSGTQAVGGLFGGIGVGYTENYFFNFVLESSNIYYGSTSSSSILSVLGWTDSVNAN